MFRPTVLLALVVVTSGTGASQSGPPLSLIATIPLPSVVGRIDHFSVDMHGRRIFMSALGNHTVEVIDTQTFQLLRSIPNLDEPQGLLFDGAANRLFVASAGDGTVKLFDGASLKPIAPIKLGDDADNIRFDFARGNVVVGYGSGALAILRPDGTKSGEIKLDAHPESFQLEKEGHRAFVNIPARLEIAVVDLDKQSIVARWHEWTDLSNFPMALDEAGHRLFAGFRNPPRLLALDTNSGKVSASADIVGDTDDLFYDAARGRVYVIGGRGFVDVLNVKDPNRFQRLAHVATSSGARTGLFVPEWNFLFVGVPKRGGHGAEVRVYEVSGGK